MPTTIKLVGMGVTKLIAAKTGIFGILKVLGVAAGGAVLPLVGLAGATWLYSQYQMGHLKEKCKLMMIKM